MKVRVFRYLGGKLFGLLLGLIGLVVLYWAPPVTLTCHYVESSQVDCVLKRRLAGLITVETTEISRLSEASTHWSTQINRDSNDREETVRISKVVLRSAAGEVALNDYAQPGLTLGNSERVTRRINDFLATPTVETLTVWQMIWLPNLLGGCFGSFWMLLVIGFVIDIGRSSRFLLEIGRRREKISKFRARLQARKLLPRD